MVRSPEASAGRGPWLGIDIKDYFDARFVRAVMGGPPREPLSRTGEGQGAPAAGQKPEQAPPRRAVPHPVAPSGATRPLPLGRGSSKPRSAGDHDRGADV